MVVLLHALPRHHRHLGERVSTVAGVFVPTAPEAAAAALSAAAEAARAADVATRTAAFAAAVEAAKVGLATGCEMCTASHVFLLGFLSGSNVVS